MQRFKYDNLSKIDKLRIDQINEQICILVDRHDWLKCADMVDELVKLKEQIYDGRGC